MLRQHLIYEPTYCSEMWRDLGEGNGLSYILLGYYINAMSEAI